MDTIRIPLSGKYGTGKHTLVDGDYDGEYFSQYTWFLTQAGYVVRKVYVNEHRYGKLRQTYLHHLVCPVKKGQWRDHINGDKLDNRSCNLRPVNRKQSAQNRAKRKDSSRPYIGVFKTSTSNKKWSINCNRINIYSRFNSALEAAEARDRLAKSIFGEYARLNFN